MIKCPGFARRDGKVSNRSTHNRYFKCKMRRFIVFWQEVEIHRNEVKLLDANNTKLEAEIRWMLCQFVFEIPLLAVWSLHPPFGIFREFFRKMSENKTTYCLQQSVIRTAIILISHALKWGPVYTHRFCLKTNIFFSFFKKIRVLTLRFWIMYSKTEFSKVSTLESVFERWVFGDRFQRIRVDGRPNRRKISPFSRVQCEHGYQVDSPDSSSPRLSRFTR